MFVNILSSFCSCPVYAARHHASVKTFLSHEFYRIFVFVLIRNKLYNGIILLQKASLFGKKVPGHVIDVNQ